MKEKVRFGEGVLAVMKEMNQDGWNVVAVLKEWMSDKAILIPGKNIVTNEGDLFYAQKAMGETPTTNFLTGGLRLGTGTTSPAKTDTDVTTLVASSGKAITSGYPKTNDSDADNTGKGTDVATWKFDYATSEVNVSGIAEGAIVDNTTTPTKALSHFLFGASFSKTSSNTLTVYVNHTFNGV